MKNPLKKIVKQFMSSSQEDQLFNGVLAALSLGVVVIIFALIFTRPESEYYTGLSFSDQSELPSFIVPGEEYSFEITIENHERNTLTYNLRILADMDGKREELSRTDVTVDKDSAKTLQVSYKLPDFTQARISATLPGAGENNKAGII